MKIQTLGDKVLVKVLKEEKKMAGRIALAQPEEEPTYTGLVVSVGSGEKIDKLKLKAGDTVMFGGHAGDNVVIDKEDHKFLRHDEVLGLVKGK